ncbi:MAG: helix-turn-helix domain-containing protein, partial [Hyphomicrobiaceae bacterium]
LMKPRGQYVVLISSIIVRRLRLAAGHDWNPEHAELEIDCPENVAPYQGIFGRSIKFGVPRTFITVGSETLDLPMPDADVRLHELIQELGEYRLHELEAASDIVDRTQDQIIALLCHGPVSLEMVARDLGLSSRSLQRHLRDEGTTFQVVLEKTRRMMTRHYLRKPDYSLTQIAFLLGFSEQSAFTRACKRWFKQTPQDLRESLLRV